MIVLITFKVLGQQKFNPFLYFQLEQTFRTYAILNPASIATTDHLLINAGNQFNGGPFNDTRKYYFQGSYYLPFTEGNSSHATVGISFQSDQEGSILSRTRWNMLFSWTTELSREWSVAMGFSLGQLGYYVAATDLSIGGSSDMLDGHVGFWFFRTEAYFGISSNQIFQGELTPIQQSFPINRVYHLIAGRDFELSHRFKIHGAVTWLLDPDYEDQLDIIVLGKFNSYVYGGLVARVERTLVLVAGFENLQFEKTIFSIGFSYSFPLGLYAPNIRIYGIDLNIRFERDDEWVTFSKSKF